MLDRRPSSLRDWGWFALVALLPVAAVALLGVRAARNEEAAAVREMGLALEGAAQQLQGRYDRAVDSLVEAGVPAVGLPSPPQDAPFVDPVVVDGRGALVSPESPPAVQERGETAPKRCRALARALAKSRAQSHQSADRREFLARCERAQTSGGRYLWPVVALDLPSRELVEPDRVEAWFRRHAAHLSPPERSAARLEIAGADWLAPDRQSRIEQLLSDASPAVRDLAALLRERRGLLRGGAADSGRVTWRDDRSVGALQLRPDGTYAGFVVHRGAIERAQGAGWPALPAGMKSTLVVGNSSASGASVRLLEGGTRLVLSWSGDGLVAARTRESLLILLGVVAAAVLIALGTVALLLRRMRAERRLGALRTDFVAAVSHELRTPIASLRMLSELLAEDRVEPEERPEIYGALAREARRLGNTVHRLLTFSRMEGGRERAQLAERSVTATVCEAVATFGDRHPDVQIRGPKAHPEVLARFDEAQLTMALDNLLQNAHKYAPDGQPYEVTVTDNEDEVCVAVKDSGPGIGAKDQARIFAPFERADDRLSEATEGSGIGLALVRHVAKTHGGRAWVASEPGRGATFSIAWPRSAS